MLPKMVNSNALTASKRNKAFSTLGSDTMESLKLFEWRLSTQESALQNLLNQTLNIKSEIVETAKETKDQAKLINIDRDRFEKDIKMLSSSMSNLTNDMQENIHRSNETGSTLKSLENHHVTSLTDVRLVYLSIMIKNNRSRITRCDQAISKIAQDLSLVNERMKSDKSAIHGNNSTVSEKLKKLEERVNSLDKTSPEMSVTMRTSYESLSQQTLDIEKRCYNNMDFFRSELNSLSQNSLNERLALENRLIERINSSLSNMETRIAKIEQTPKDDSLNTIVRERIDLVEKELNTFKLSVTKTFRELEVRMNKLAEDLSSNQYEELQTTNKEMQDGFKHIHDTVNHVKTVLDGKHKLLEESIRQEMSQLRKLVVLM